SAPMITAITESVHAVKGEMACITYITCATVVGGWLTGVPVSCSISVIGDVLPWEELCGEAEAAHVGHAHGIQDAIEVVDLVLHHAGVEPFGHAVDGLAVLVEAGVAQLEVARHDPAHARHREASL